MKRYALFAYDAFYPAGGWGDFVNAFDTAEEAFKAATKTKREYSEVIDLHTGEEILEPDAGLITQTPAKLPQGDGADQISLTKTKGKSS
ncbi:hypothetical protein [Hyphococcus sp.]|uniref:hypothetical protein n=1 Tax=Hyphococcus sp. TaxID=2038636 RepID=UPI00208680D2|nr:MAG: hypothetical protein DHS20C04_27270 [Marinicaulis sp.]